MQISLFPNINRLYACAAGPVRVYYECIRGTQMSPAFKQIKCVAYILVYDGATHPQI